MFVGCVRLELLVLCGSLNFHGGGEGKILRLDEGFPLVVLLSLLLVIHLLEHVLGITPISQHWRAQFIPMHHQLFCVHIGDDLLVVLGVLGDNVGHCHLP